MHLRLSCGRSGCSGGCNELAEERLQKQRTHLIEGKINEEEKCPTTAEKDEEHPDRNTDEHLGARFPHQGEEAGSIVFHSSSNASEIRNNNNEARATASAAAKVIEDLSIKNAEILRPIEERRSTPKEEKQQLKVLSKCIKNASEKKRMKRQQDIQRMLEDFKGVRNILGIESAKKKVLIKKIKKTTKENASHLEKELPTSLVNSTKDFTMTTRTTTLNMKVNDDDNYSNTDVHNNKTEEMTGIPQITTEELQTAINKLKEGKSPNSKGIRAEDLKHVMTKRENW